MSTRARQPSRPAPRSARCRSAKGTVFEIVDGNRARELAPGLSDRIVRGVYYPHGMHTINPYRVVATLAERFAADGGTHPARPRARLRRATAIA